MIVNIMCPRGVYTKSLCWKAGGESFKMRRLLLKPMHHIVSEVCYLLFDIDLAWRYVVL